ncbi:MAG: hypothetical protein SOV26_02695 [Candidatus Onthovivens sp.]|nr:hypothetical protein [Candidatus Onthovivens sp.]
MELVWFAYGCVATCSDSSCVGVGRYALDGGYILYINRYDWLA